MPESNVPESSSRGRKLAICALVLALVALILAVRALVRIGQIDTRVYEIALSREDRPQQAPADTTAYADAFRDREQTAKRLAEVTARLDELAAQYKTLAERVRASRPQANLLLNGGFEDVQSDGRPANWRSMNVGGQHEGPRTKPVLDTAVKLEGNSSLRIDHVETGQYTYAFQTRSTRSHLKPNTDYLYTGHFRVENIVPDKASGGIKLIVSTGSHDPFALSDQPNFAAEGAWQKLEVRFNTGDREPIYLGITFHRCKGILWLDDFRLEEAELER